MEDIKEMFAIIRTGGKQYKVSKGIKVVVEKIDAPSGSKIIISDVLMIGSDAGVSVGAPSLEKAEVIAVVEKQTRDDKIIVFKKKRRHNYRRKKGHKQQKTMLRIEDILQFGKSLVPLSTEPAKERKETKGVQEEKVEVLEHNQNKTSAPKTPQKKKVSSKKKE